jgi:signal transduction histidine kinase
MPAERIDLFLFDPAVSALMATGGSPPRSARLHELGLDRLPLANGGREAEVYMNGTPYRSGNVDLDTGVLRGFRYELGMLSMMIVPLEVNGERLGVMQVASDHMEAFTAQDLAFVQEVARWLSVIVQRTQAAEQLADHTVAQARQDTADELITMLAHELNNYLTPIQGRVALLRRRADREQRVADLDDLAALSAVVERLGGLVTNLLTVERLEQGLFTIHPEPVDLAALTRACVQTFGTDRVPIELHRAGPGDLMVAADPMRLRQVLENLLVNAVKHSPPGVGVQVAVATEERAGGRWGTVTVRDHGPGIPPEQVPHLFTRFAPGPDSSSMGLGLFIAHQLTAAHSGTLTYAPAEGGGSAFHLALPLVDRSQAAVDPGSNGSPANDNDKPSF